MSLLHVWHSLDYFFPRICEKCVTRQQKYSNKRHTLLHFLWCIVTCCRRTCQKYVLTIVRSCRASFLVIFTTKHESGLCMFVVVLISLKAYGKSGMCFGTGYRSAKQYMFRWGVNTTEKGHAIRPENVCTVGEI